MSFFELSVRPRIVLVTVVFWVALSGCSHLTVVPKPVIAHEIAWDGNVQNAGLIDCNSTGCLVTRGWMFNYANLEKEFNHTVAGDSLIRMEGENYRVPFEVTDHYISLQRAKRGP